MGREVPQSYYVNGKPDTTNKKPLVVPNGSKQLLDFQIDKAGAILK